MKNSIGLIFVIVLFFACASSAQDSVPVKTKQSYLNDHRHWAIEVPIWIPGFRGEFAYGDIGLEGEDGASPFPDQFLDKPKFGDVFKRVFKTGWDLNYFFVTSATYQNGRFYGSLDAFSGTVGGSLKFRYNNAELVRVKTHIDLARIVGAYQLTKYGFSNGQARYELWGYTGVRLHNFNISSDLGEIDRTLQVDPLWIEPVFGIKNELVLDYWKFIIEADMGSFGIDDKFSYMLNFHAFYRISNLLSLKMGWNGWYSRYNDRFKNDDLSLQVHLAGPVAALEFTF